jgi:shikimate kinase
MMGSGKSTIGRLLTGATGWPLYDNDRLLDEMYGLSARQILERDGEAGLRAAEDAALVAGLTKPPPAIVGAAAGTILSAEVRGLLLEHTVVWLRAAPETVIMRARGAAHRPWLDRGEAWFREAAEERAPLYAAVADVIVDTDWRSPDDAAREIMNSLPAGARRNRSIEPPF